MLRILAAALCLIFSLSTPAKAEIPASVAKDLNRLSGDIRDMAAPVSALSPASNPAACLNYHDFKPHPEKGFKGTVARCRIAWEHATNIEILASTDGSNRIRLANLNNACLTSVGEAKPYWVGCWHALPGSVWQLRGKQLVDRTGKCLEAAEIGAGAYDVGELVLSPCSANASNQAWNAVNLAIAAEKNGDSFQYHGQVHTEWNDLPMVVEQLRPRFQTRVMTSAEKAEVRAITSPYYKRYDLIKILFNSGSLPIFDVDYISWAKVQRLMELGETGDKDAMKAVVYVTRLLLQNGIDANQQSSESSGKIRFAAALPFGKYSDQFTFQAIRGLNRIWAAHYWQRHGPDRLAAAAVTRCLPFVPGQKVPTTSFCGGYSVQMDAQVRNGQTLQSWEYSGKTNELRNFTVLKFSPLVDFDRSNTESENIFFRDLNRVAAAFTKSRTASVPLEKVDNIDWNMLYIHSNNSGKGWLYKNIYLNSKFGNEVLQRFHAPPFSVNAPHELQQITKFSNYWFVEENLAGLLADPSPADARVTVMGYYLREGTPAQIERFASRFAIADARSLAILCTVGRESSEACLRSRAQAQREAAAGAAWLAEYNRESARNARNLALEREARAKVEQKRFMENPRKPGLGDFFAAFATGFAGGAAYANQAVTVRQYDQYGNYTGSYNTTTGIADAEGAKP